MIHWFLLPKIYSALPRCAGKRTAKGVNDLLRVFGVLPCRALVFVPLAGDALKGGLSGVALPLFLLPCQRVDTLMQQALDLAVQLSRLLQADFAVNAKRQCAVLACETVAVTPVFAALRCDEQIQPAAVKEIARSLGGFGLSDGDFGEGHGQKVGGDALILA